MTDYKPEDYINYRLQRAKETIKEVETLIEYQFWNIDNNNRHSSKKTIY